MNLSTINQQSEIKAYMTFRDGKPLEASIIFDEKYKLYDKKAPLFQKGDKSVEVTITYKII